MKKIIFVLLILAFASLWPSHVRAQTDCRKIFNQESYKCLTDSNTCQEACSKETEKPDGTAYFNSGEIYKKCIKSSDCEGKSSACSERALANFRACGKSVDLPKAAEAKKETPPQDENPIIQLIADWTMETKVVPKNLEETANWQPIITPEVEQSAWREFLPVYVPKEENITTIKGEAEIKSPTSLQFIPIGPRGGDTVHVTYLDSTVRATSDAVQLRYTWSADSGAVMNVPKWSEIKFQQPVTDEKTQEIKRLLKLNKGELEVRVKNANSKEKFGVQGDFFDLSVNKTHFWVSQSTDKKIAIIGVYEGEVEVKTNDGQTVKVVPDGDKPGVVVVSRKLSIVKLGLVGLVLVIVIAGVVFLQKRKISVKKSNKKRFSS